jgi:hypothetical protein
MKARWESYLENIKAEGWRVRYKERDRFGKTQWWGEAVKDGKRLTVTAGTLEDVMLRLWQLV